MTMMYVSYMQSNSINVATN